jgi:hypothetical protein
MRLILGMLLVAATSLACDGPPAAPSSPRPVPVTEAASAADGSTLKVTAPAPQQPASGSVTSSLTPNLVIANSTFRFLGDVAFVRTLQYRFVVETSAGSVVSDVVTGAGVELTGSRVPAGALLPQTVYRWRVRAELGSAFGPWSSYSTFTTPKS